MRRSLVIAFMTTSAIVMSLTVVTTRNRTANEHNSATTPPPPPATTVINIAFVCSNSSDHRIFTRAISTLLTHRTAVTPPYHIHLVGDEPCYRTLQRILYKLKVTTATAGVSSTFYAAQRHLKAVAWIPNAHYSGVFGLLKLIVADILPSHVRRCVVLDTDIAVNSDMEELWKFFDDFEPAQAIGAAPELSSWYRTSRWPALHHRGFNTGVMLMDLEKLRALRWNVVWRAVLRSCLATLERTDLGDQDVVNAVASRGRRPELIYELSCVWNVQWRVGRRKCFVPELSLVLVKIVHFNTPSKELSVELWTRELIEFMRNLKPSRGES